MSSLKQYPRLPVHIVEDHNEALRPMLRAVATKHLPFAGNLLIHLDSHPDLLLPPRLLKADVFNKDVLFDKLSIENWIMPAVFAGHYDELVWVKPPWSSQIPDGVHHFSIGIERDTGYVKVSSDLLYFVSEMLYCSRDQLDERRDVTLHVLTLGDRTMVNQASNSSQCDPQATDETVTCADKAATALHTDCSAPSVEQVAALQTVINKHNGLFVLDVDLDFFTTLNPFMSAHEDVNMYDRIKEIYKFDLNSNQSVDDNQKRRKEQMVPLEKFFQTLDALKDPAAIREELQQILEMVPNLEHRKLLQSLVPDLLEDDSSSAASSNLDWLFIHDAGCTWDSTEHVLPHHPSTDDEIRTLMHEATTFLDHFQPPTLVTLARSSVDDYCPADKVDFVQDLLCSYLRSKYTDIDCTEHY